MKPNANWMLGAGLLMLALAAAPAVAAAPAQATGPGGAGCYGYYDYDQKMCYGVDSSNVAVLCGLAESACNLVRPAGPAHAAPAMGAQVGCGQPVPCCIRVLDPIALYDPTTGQKITDVTTTTYYVGTCHHP